MNNIKVGTSGFSFPDWRGIVYPKALPQKDTLKYYEEELGFDCVEINSTYYTLVSAKAFQSMQEKTSPDFEFIVKGFKGFTHDPFDDRLGTAKPPLKKALEDIDRFNFSIQPLKDAGKLGGILLQFPVFFEPSEKSKEYILTCKNKFKDAPFIIEFRNRAWAREATFKFLRENKIGFCIVDEPKLERLMPFMNEVTTDPAYLRLHGRNKNWFNAKLSERYDYLYSDVELKSFVPEVDKMAQAAQNIYIMFNNCHAGSAIKNALTLKQLLNITIKKNKLF
ncbi:MAG: hypothetical protein A3J83_05615 [Elusimicrobia bacterium RIFOXYA2_FULL_40_6]|nr:MAG: hypothetical protein A3J83_05615 [Elusimicrobia bacterium RIFOXYA2_FULL_40_6]